MIIQYGVQKLPWTEWKDASQQFIRVSNNKISLFEREFPYRMMTGGSIDIDREEDRTFINSVHPSGCKD